MKLLNTKSAAAELNVNPQRVRAMAAAGTLRGQRVGRDWVFTEQEVARVKALPRPGGRPKKNPENIS